MKEVVRRPSMSGLTLVGTNANKSGSSIINTGFMKKHFLVAGGLVSPIACSTTAPYFYRNCIQFWNGEIFHALLGLYYNFLKSKQEPSTLFSLPRIYTI